MKAKEVLEKLNITRPTLTKYVKTGLIKVDSEINGQYNYNEESVYSLLGKASLDKTMETEINKGDYVKPKIVNTDIEDLIRILENESIILTQLGQLRLLQPSSIEKLKENKKLLTELKERRKNE